MKNHPTALLLRACALSVVSTSLLAQTVTLGTGFETEDTVPSCSQFHHQSDGQWPVLPDALGLHTLIFWGNQDSHRIYTDLFYSTYTDPRDWLLSPSGPVIGPGPGGQWNGSLWEPSADSGGSWLYNVIRVTDSTCSGATTLYAFYHVEDHEWPQAPGQPPIYSWVPRAACALARSCDDGITWEKLGTIVETDKPRFPYGTNPELSQDPNYQGQFWNGTGAPSVRWDPVNNGWFMMYHSFSWGGIRMARTFGSNPAGPWKKYHDGAWSEPALPAGCTPMPCGGDSLLDGLRGVPYGTNPNLHWNTYLNRWVAVFNWNDKFYLATCADLNTPTWSSPKVFLDLSATNHIMYPCIIGDTPEHGISSQFAGKDATLVYAKWPTTMPEENRTAVRVPISFDMTPVPQFATSTTVVARNRPVQFTDGSANEPASWSWNFGDGTSSTAQNPTHSYATAGIYQVTLTVTNTWSSGGVTSAPTTVTVGAPDVEFIAANNRGAGPLAVKFLDRSTDAPTSWLWDFGDGTTSTEQFPTHTYSTPGTYDVGLAASNSYGTLSRSRSAAVEVGTAIAPVASFTASPTTGGVGMTTQFTDTSTNVPTGWLWDFGDGGTSTERNPVHTYTAAGSYAVVLQVDNADGSDGIAVFNKIVVSGSTVTGVTSSSFASYCDQVQGAGNWYYYEWDGDGLTPMTLIANMQCYGAEWQGTGWTGTPGQSLVNNMLQYGQLSTVNRAVRAYKVQHAGTVHVQSAPQGFGRVNDKDRGDGLVAYVSVTDSLTSLGRTVFERYYPYDRLDLDTLDLEVPAKEGEWILFHTDMLQSSGWDFFKMDLLVTEQWGGPPPQAAFTADTTSVVAGFDVTFDSTASTGGVFAWEWDFESDGRVDSTKANPTHKYLLPGFHDVTLKVHGDWGMSVLRRPAYISVTGTVEFVSIGAEDGYVTQGSGPGHPTGAVADDATIYGMLMGDSGSDMAMRTIVSFDTSTLPDTAVVDSALLVLNSQVLSGSAAGFLPRMMDVKTGTFGAASLDPSDFNASGSVTVTLPNIGIPGQPWSLSLGEATSAVNVAGRTQIRVRWSTLTDSDGIADYAGFCPGEFANQVQRPKLRVTFH